MHQGGQAIRKVYANDLHMNVIIITALMFSTFLHMLSFSFCVQIRYKKCKVQLNKHIYSPNPNTCTSHQFPSNSTKIQHDCADISTGPLRREAAEVINGAWWIMSILCDWTEPAESLKVREEHFADCCPKTAH